MHDGMPYGRNQGQGQGQGHSREVDRQSPMGLIFYKLQLQAITVREITLTIKLLPSTNTNTIILSRTCVTGSLTWTKQCT